MVLEVVVVVVVLEVVVVGGYVPVVIALHVRCSERESSPELTRSTSLTTVIGSVIQHFENIPRRSTI